MRRILACSAVVLSLAIAGPAAADFLAFDAQAQAGFTQLSNLVLPGSTPEATGSLSGFALGVRGRAQVLMVNVVLDYQHFTSNADLLHLGLGVYVDTDLLPAIKPYASASAGLLMLSAAGSAFDPKAAENLAAQLGGMARAGVGLEFPFAADFFAIGASADVGAHYITGKLGYNFSVMGYIGLRI